MLTVSLKGKFQTQASHRLCFSHLSTVAVVWDQHLDHPLSAAATARLLWLLLPASSRGDNKFERFSACILTATKKLSCHGFSVYLLFPCVVGYNLFPKLGTPTCFAESAGISYCKRYS